MPQLKVHHLGVVPYGAALAMQRDFAARRISGEQPDDLLLLVEHPAVVTLGRSTKAGNLLASPDVLAARGVELFDVERGGDVTFHGPGQLVGYPIFDLKQHRKDLHWYLRQVEEALVVALRPYGIVGMRSPGQTGVWVGTASAVGDQVPARKIASIGVHARDWVTWHGFALNVATDLTYFDVMVPCGIANVQMTSVAAELERRATSAAPAAGAEGERGFVPALPATTEAAAKLVATAFGEVFGFDQVISIPLLED